MKLLDILKLKFLPASSDLGLLVLRVWLGLSMFFIHGLDKLQHFGATVSNFQKMGFATPLAWAAVLAESVASALLVLGLFTRLAAAVLMTQMGVAFIKVHQMNLKAGDAHSGEIAFIYLAGFVAIFLTGGGSYSVDGKAKS